MSITEEYADFILRKQRRERIATACLNGILSDGDQHNVDVRRDASMAVAYADALIAELDRPKENPKP
jgi:hypothetical protein